MTNRCPNDQQHVLLHYAPGWFCESCGIRAETVIREVPCAATGK